jgi:hypothetical protein
MKNEFTDFTDLDAMKNNPESGKIDELFRSVIKEEKKVSTKQPAMSAAAESNDAPNELDLDSMDELDISLGESAPAAEAPSTLDEGMDLNFSSDESLDLGTGMTVTQTAQTENDQFGDLSLDADEGFSLEAATAAPEELLDTGMDLGADDGLSLDDMDLGMDLSAAEPIAEENEEEEGLSLSDTNTSTHLKLSADLSELNDDALDDLSFGSEEAADLSDDAKKKLEEIDAIMVQDASQIDMTRHALQLESLRAEGALDENLDEPLVSDDLNLESLDFNDVEEVVEEVEEKTVIASLKDLTKKKKKEPVSEAKELPRDFGRDLNELSGAYSGEMERMQATISNLRTDRQELLTKIQKLEEGKVLESRQSLTMRAELDEKKIELTIIRKKLNEEINDLKDRLKLFDEKKLIMEEKNRILTQELDKAAQKNKIDVKKVQLRERELEQKLELLKSDAESQIRHRDLKILELKRRIDAMEFDMESISLQEKRSVESRFELEDKLEKAIKTLRGAITVLEDESDRSNALDALKKNIDM